MNNTGISVIHSVKRHARWIARREFQHEYGVHHAVTDNVHVIPIILRLRNEIHLKIPLT